MMMMSTNNDQHWCKDKRSCSCCKVHLYILKDKGKKVWILEKSFDVRVRDRGSLTSLSCYSGAISTTCLPARISTVSDQVLLYWFNGESLGKPMDREEELSMNVKKPYVGMSFYSRDDARNHYAQYGREHGFSIRVRNSSKSGWRGNEVTSTKFDKNTSYWVVSKFEDIHNHKQVTPSKRMKMKSNRTMPEAVKNLTEAFHRENLKVSKLPDVIGGDHIGFEKRDCYNHLRNVRQKNMEGGDAQTVLNYFKKKQLEDLSFFYDIQVDEDGRAVNFFWIDHHARMAYEYFGNACFT